MIGLVDCQNFFVSCERVFRPDLQSHPVIVLSNNDGCIIARSEEVKKLGIPMGAPLFKYKKIISDHNICVFSSNFKLYGDLSQRIMSLLRQIVSSMEVYSIDEAFLDISSIKNFRQFALDTKEMIQQCVGVPVNIGISPSKVLCKIASDIAKNQNGVCILDNLNFVDDYLKKISVKDVWGVGKRIALKLKQMGIHTAYDLKHFDPRLARTLFTVIGERLIRELNGISCLPVNNKNQESFKHSIQVSRSFGKKIYQYDELHEAIATYTFRLTEKLRRQDLAAKSFGVYIKNSPFEISYMKSQHFIDFEIAIYSTNQFLNHVSKILNLIYKPHIGYIKAGVIAFNLTPRSRLNTQGYIFKPCTLNLTPPLSYNLEKSIDLLNLKYGKECVRLAACGIDREWLMKCNLKSPGYTYKWDELKVVN